jgi:regulator of sigma E protease
MTNFQTVLAFFLAIGPLIIFHELGHYLVARLCGVKVLRFSLGMGKVVWSRRFGRDQTEWALSLLPIGGYVKMLDDRDPETAATNPQDASREFTRQSVWRRMAIVVAGPLFNFILAIAVFTGLYMYGVDDMATRVRAMPEASALYQAGVRGGDKVVAVNGESVPAWSDLRWAVLDAVMDKTELRLDVVQPGGAQYAATVPQAAIARLNLESDVLTDLGLVPQMGQALVGDLANLGDSPAVRAGMQAGDAFVAVDGKPVMDGLDVVTAVRASGGKPLQVSVRRAGQVLVLAVTPQLDPSGKFYRLNAPLVSSPELIKVPRGPVTALSKAVVSTWERAVMQLKMLGKIVTLQLSAKNISGPFTIGEFAGKAARAGVLEFLGFVAVISISLGVMNLLPIPMLDGGHLLYYSLEVLTGRPLPERFVGLAQRAGVVMLVMLMSLALFNDAERYLKKPPATPNTSVRSPHD